MKLKGSQKNSHTSRNNNGADSINENNSNANPPMLLEPDNPRVDAATPGLNQGGDNNDTTEDSASIDPVLDSMA